MTAPKQVISEEDCKSIEHEEGTFGGTTYYITRHDSVVREALCFRGMRHMPNLRCAREAGFGTKHRGTGACRYHGGNAGRPPSTGKHAVQTRKRLKDDIQTFLDGDRTKLLNLDRELAAIRVIFQEFLETFPEPESDNYGVALHRAQALIGSAGSLVDKITRVEARTTLTANQVLYLRATVVDLLVKYILDPDKRGQAVEELMFRLGGSGKFLIES